MYKMYICIAGTAFEIDGLEAAWDAYHKAVPFAKAIGAIVDLVDGETGEVIESSDGSLD